MGVLRAARIAAVWAWAGALMLFGLAVWRQSGGLAAPIARWTASDPGAILPIARCVAVAAMAAALLVFMLLVADELFPKAPMMLTGFLKALTTAVLWAALVWALWLTWRLLD